LASSRWRNWRPQGERLGTCVENELTKPTKDTSVGFVGSIAGESQNFFDRQVDPAEWRAPFKEWLRARCICAPRWFTAIYALHDDYCNWEIALEGVPCTHDMFLQLLTDSGFLVDGSEKAALVSGLVLLQDVYDFNLTVNGRNTAA
jgi:hypothetical protein